MKKVKIATFLKERKIKLKPDEANNSNLKRIEKIDFDGDITIVPTNTKTDMILVKKGDLIISGINVEKGALSIYQGEEDVLASIHYSAYEFDETQIYILYLKYFLKSREFRRLLMEQSGSGIKNEIKAKHILPLEIQLPSIQEQHKIVERIQAVENDIVELNEKIIQQYDDCKNLRQSILQQAVEGKLCEQKPDDEPISDLLERIREEKLKKCKNEKEYNYIQNLFNDVIINNNVLNIHAELICDNITKGTTPKSNELKELGDIPYLKVYNIVNNRIDFKSRPQFISLKVHNSFLERSKVYPNDVLINIVGPPLGKVALVPSDYNEWNINQALAIFRGLSNIIPKYLYYVLAEGSLIKNIATVGTAGQDNISLAQCREIIIPLPSVLQQQRIVDKVDKLMLLCDQLENEVNKAQQYAAQLMESVLKEAFLTDEQAVKEHPKYKGKVILIRPEQNAELRFAMAARGNIKQSTLESLQKRAIEISNGEK